MQFALFVHWLCCRVEPSLLILLFFTSVSFAQTGGLEGRVVDEMNMPLKNSVIIIENSNHTTETDTLGIFIFKNIDPGKYLLSVKVDGFKNQMQSVDVFVGKIAKINFILHNDLLQSEQNIALGFSSVSKKENSGSVDFLKKSDFKEHEIFGFDKSMQGRITGVSVVSENGMSGSSARIRVRGASSIFAGAEPLYVIDGIPFTDSDYSFPDMGYGTSVLSEINSDDIESVNILKDASTAALYGARGANGVIAISTQKGKVGKTKFNAAYSFGIITETNRLDFLNAKEHLELRDSALHRLDRSRDVPSTDLSDGWLRWQANQLAGNVGTNWVDKVFKTGNYQNLNISASGGNNRTVFYYSGAYSKENGFIIGNSIERFSGRMNIENKITDKFILGANVSLSNSRNKRIPTGIIGGLGDAQRMQPFFPTHNLYNEYFMPSRNPLWQLENIKNTVNSLRNTTSIYGEYQFLDNLKFRSEWSAGFLNIHDVFFKFRNTQDSASESEASNLKTNVVTGNTNNFLTYSLDYDSIHKFQVLLGNSFEKALTRQSVLNGSNFPDDFFDSPYGALNTSGFYHTTGHVFISNFLRVNYKLFDKYFAVFSIRNDGSSRFGESDKYCWFPAFSTGWIVSDELFMKNIKYLSFLKIHSSIGLTGNSNIGDDTQTGFYNVSNGYNGVAGMIPESLPNSFLTSEKSLMFDCSLDFGFFKNRLSGTLSYYHKNTNNLLLNTALPASSGYSFLMKNSGKLIDNGFEISTHSVNFKNKDFCWQTDFNISFERSKLIDIQELSSNSIRNELQQTGSLSEGYPIGQNFLVRYAGVSQYQQIIAQHDAAGNIIGTDTAQAGRALYFDKFGNLMTSENKYFYYHRVACGNPNPKFYGGITNSFKYKEYDCSILVNFVYGNTIYDESAKYQIGNWEHQAQLREILDTWTPTHTNTEVPAISNDPLMNSDRFLYKVSYIRLRSVSFGYTFPDAAIRKYKIESCRLYFKASNYFTFTKFAGWDPEVYGNLKTNLYSRNTSFATTSYQTPQAKTLGLGIQIVF